MPNIRDDGPKQRRTQRLQIRALTDETLKLYREVNLLYRIGERLSGCHGVAEVCGVVRAECKELLRARSAQVELLDGRTYGPAPVAEGVALKVSIQVKDTHFGHVIVSDQGGRVFSAADRKLVQAVADYAGVALQNAALVANLTAQNLALAAVNRELQVIDAMKTDFISNVSHELRTPLASVKGFAATILNDAEMPREVIMEFVGIIDSEADTLVVMVNDLLDSAKLLSGQLRYTMGWGPLEAIVGDVVASLSVQARARNIELRAHIEDTARVLHDRVRMHQVLTNLVSNAIKFTDEGSVVVRQWIAGGEACVEVRDTGIGIEMADLSRIFEKFYRVENVVHTREGTGLGLALTRGIMEKHGGRVEASSAVGVGSIFTFYLPLGGGVDEAHPGR